MINMNHLHHTNYHASTLSEIQRTVYLLQASVSEIKGVQNSPINVANLEGLVNTLKSKVDTLSANMAQYDAKFINVENRIAFLESRDPKLPPNLESSLQLKLEHYMTKCVKERIDMLNIPGMKVQLEEKISNLANQLQTLTTLPAPQPTPPAPQPTPSAPQLPEIDSIINESTDAPEDIDISFKTRRQVRKPKA